MPLKSIVDIDVNDTKFREFQALFDRYREGVANTSGAWGKVAQSTNSASAALDAMTKKHAADVAVSRMDMEARRRAAELMKRQDYEALNRMGRIKKESEAWGQAVGKVAGQWKAVSIYSAKTSTNLASAAVSLLKWTSALGVASALLGAGGGLFGIERLALGTSDKRRQSMVTGVPIGRQTAFDVDYKRFGDTQAITRSIATAQTDVTSDQYKGLLGAGIRPTEIQQKNAADLGVELFEKLPRLFPKGPKDPTLGPRATGLGLTSVISIEDIKSYLRASPEERETQRKAYGKDAGDLRIDDPVARAWQDLTTQLGRASSKIEATFVTGLVPLAKPIGDLSSAFSDLTGAFLKSDIVKTGIEDLANGFAVAAKYVSTPDFQNDVKSFADDVGHMAKALADAYKWVSGLFDGGRTKSTPEEDKKQEDLAKFDPSAERVTHGEGIWHRAFNSGKHGHSTVRSLYNDDKAIAREREKIQALRDGRPYSNTDPKVKSDIAVTAKATTGILDAVKARQDGFGAGSDDTAGGGGGGGGMGHATGYVGRVLNHFGRTAFHGQGHFGEKGWWTPDRQSHAVDYLMKNAGLTEDGAKALVARWRFVESAGGPASVNPNSGATGIGQWLGDRKTGGYNGTFDQQLQHASDEMNGKYQQAKRLLNTPGSEGRGASNFERAEGWNARTSTDNFTGTVQEGMKHISHGVVPPSPDAAHPVQERTLGRYIHVTKPMAARGEMPHPTVYGPDRLDPAHQKLADAMRQAAAKAAEGLPKTKPLIHDDGHGRMPPSGIRHRASGLSMDRFQRKPMPHVMVQNNTGANVNVTAAMAGATVGYG